MVTFTDKEREIIADAERFLQRRANTLGSDGYLVSEPFLRNKTVLLADIMQSTPTAATNLDPPFYDDFPVDGSIGIIGFPSSSHSFPSSSRSSL